MNPAEIGYIEIAADKKAAADKVPRLILFVEVHDVDFVVGAGHFCDGEVAAHAESLAAPEVETV